MKRERKEQLLTQFPALPAGAMEQMKGRGTRNFVVLITRQAEGELYARCYHRYSDGHIAERQRYVFAKDGAVRYGKSDYKPWEIRTEFREPVFCQSGYGYSFDNSYCVLNYEAIKQSWMKYAPISDHTSLLYMEYLGLYCKHPNVEYLIKQGYGFLISEEYFGYWGTHTRLSISPLINWKSNNLLKMLGLNKNEFKALHGRERLYPDYRMWRDRFPKYSIEDILQIAYAFGYEYGTAERFVEATGLKLRRLARYLYGNEIRPRDYNDYIGQCKKLKYNLHDTAISMPHDFNAMHTRLSNIIKYGNSEGLSAVFRKHIEKRRQLEFYGMDLFIRQPESFEEIIAEGKALHHCVGSYAERHSLGKLHIMFIRSKAEPDKPYYTMEVSVAGRIVQVRGERNCDPTQEVSTLIAAYTEYLKTVFRKAHKRKSA